MSRPYRLARAVRCFSVIVPRTGRCAGVTFAGSVRWTGIDVATFPGGGDPSAVKSDFCSASVFALGTGLTTGSFMAGTFAEGRSAAFRGIRARRLCLDVHALHRRFPGRPPGQNTRNDGCALKNACGARALQRNGRPHSRFRVIFPPFDGSRPSQAPPLDVLTGLLHGAGKTSGRPVGVAIDRQGCLLVADGVGNGVWRVTLAP